MFKVNDKNTRTTLLALLVTLNAPFSSASIVNLKTLAVIYVSSTNQSVRGNAANRIQGKHRLEKILVSEKN